MKHLFVLSVCAASLFVFSCKKDSRADQNRSVLMGSWIYKTSLYDITTFNADGSLQGENTSSRNDYNGARNHITFANDGVAYMVEEGWGPGFSGSLFIDTVPYRVTDNAILLSFPGGGDLPYYPAGFTYPAYQDTLVINSLSADSLSFTRRYHYRHTGPAEIKQSTDQMQKQ